MLIYNEGLALTIMDKIKQFIARYEIPPAIAPYVTVLARSEEIDLIVAMAGQTCSVDQVADLLAIPSDQAKNIFEFTVKPPKGNPNRYGHNFDADRLLGFVPQPNLRTQDP